MPYPRGRFAVADVIADPDMDDAPPPTSPNGPAASPVLVTTTEFAHALAEAGLVDIDIQETHRVYPTPVPQSSARASRRAAHRRINRPCQLDEPMNESRLRFLRRSLVGATANRARHGHNIDSCEASLVRRSR